MADALGRTPIAELEARLELSANPYGGFAAGRMGGPHFALLQGRP